MALSNYLQLSLQPYLQLGNPMGPCRGIIHSVGLQVLGYSQFLLVTRTSKVVLKFLQAVALNKGVKARKHSNRWHLARNPDKPHHYSQS